MKSSADRKRDERERRKALGLVRVEFWILPKYIERLKRYVEKLLNKETGK